MHLRDVRILLFPLSLVAAACLGVEGDGGGGGRPDGGEWEVRPGAWREWLPPAYADAVRAVSALNQVARSDAATGNRVEACDKDRREANGMSSERDGNAAQRGGGAADDGGSEKETEGERVRGRKGDGTTASDPSAGAALDFPAFVVTTASNHDRRASAAAHLARVGFSDVVMMDGLPWRDLPSEVIAENNGLGGTPVESALPSLMVALTHLEIIEVVNPKP
jgi:hypothetical protein